MGGVDVDKANEEDKENAEHTDKLPSSEREPLQFGPLSGRQIVKQSQDLVKLLKEKRIT
jgi:hypothetical protein